MQKKTVDGVKVPVGVIWLQDRQKWRVRITVNGEKVNLGNFDTLEQAVEARRKAESERGVKPKLRARDAPPLQQMIEAMSYNPVTGAITWDAEKWPWIQREASGIGCTGGFIWLGKARFAEYRLAWRLVYGKWPKYQIRHLNGDIADNQILNIYDLAKPVIKSKDKAKLFFGIRVRKNRFRLTMKMEGKRTVIGTYDTAQEAAYARILTAQKRNALKKQKKLDAAKKKAAEGSAPAPEIQTKRVSRW